MQVLGAGSVECLVVQWDPDLDWTFPTVIQMNVNNKTERELLSYFNPYESTFKLQVPLKQSILPTSPSPPPHSAYSICHRIILSLNPLSPIGPN